MSEPVLASHPDAPARGGEPLGVREAYRLWADRYETETAVSALEDRLVRQRPVGGGQALLDAGCGTGRRLAAVKERFAKVAGVDLVFDMLRAGRVRDRERRNLVAADLRALPFADGTFDLVWCRLVMGHLPELRPAYRELRRVAAEGAELVVTDFHPAATAAGHERTFRDASGRLHTVEHHVHTLADSMAAAGAEGWFPLESVEATAGPEEEPFYRRAGRGDQYERERTLPLIRMMCFRA